MFPQLICILIFGVANGYRAIAGLAVALAMRVLCGEPVFSLPVILRFPGCTSEDGVYAHCWPFKSVCTLCSLASILMVSYLASVLFNKGLLPGRWDAFKVTAQGAEGAADEEKDDKFATESMLTSEFKISAPMCLYPRIKQTLLLHFYEREITVVLFKN